MSQGTVNEHSIQVFISHPLVWWILIGLLAGWLAGVVTRGRGFGCLADIVIGLVGAVIGGWVFSKLGITAFGFFGSVAAATVGAVLLVAVARLLSGGGRDY
jgi:uncharacterized membrane protein YeaQ/YmgE (transglycosylase-associated protein family)